MGTIYNVFIYEGFNHRAREKFLSSSVNLTYLNIKI